MAQFHFTEDTTLDRNKWRSNIETNGDRTLGKKVS